MKHLRLLLIVVAVTAMQAVAAKPKTQEFTNSMIRIEIPADFTVQEADNIITFTAPNEKSDLSVFMVNYLCMEVINIFEEEQIEISLTTAIRTFSKKAEKEYSVFNCTEPVRDKNAELPTYYSTYTASTGTGKSVKGYVMATIHNGCLFMGAIQHENAKMYDLWVDYLHTMQPINSAAEKETDLNRLASEESVTSSVPLTKTYNAHGITFRYPDKMLVTESVKEDGEVQLVCNYAGDNTAIMNLNFASNPIFAMVDKQTALEACGASVQEMAVSLSSIYSSMQQSEIQTDANWPYPNKYTEFQGKMFGMTMKGRLETYLMGSYIVVIVQQADTDEMIRMLQAIKQTIQKAE